MTTATPVPTADLRRVLETRLLCFPRFRKRVETDPLGASWIEDENFDLDAHFVVTALPGKGGRHELQALAARLASQRFDPARPLWQLHFVERYGTGSAWVLRLHHCYADGIAMIRVLLSLTEQDAGPALAGAHEGGIARRAARTTQRRRGPVAAARLGQPADPTRGRHRRKRPGRRRATARDGRAQAVSSGDRRGGRAPGEGHGRRIRAGRRAARRPGVAPAGTLEWREARVLVGAARPAGGQDREPGARLHRQRRADVHRGRRARRVPARGRVRHQGRRRCARRCR